MSLSMQPDFVEQGAERYVTGPVERFDEKYMMFRRVMWDMPELAVKLYFTPKVPREGKPGYSLMDVSLRNATWDLERAFGMGNRGGKAMLLDWERPPMGEFAPPRGLKIDTGDPAGTTTAIKRAARFMGASLVGVSELDMRWVYSHAYYPQVRNPFAGEPLTADEITDGKSEEIIIPPEYRYCIVLAFEMDYQLTKYSPTYTASAGAGLCYSKMPFVAAMVAQFIRGLGYNAIPQGNDTALSVPLAIDAGLGELGRNGILITPQYGPRVRLAKVFTDLPLIPDRPIQFGVWEFCEICEKCAKKCPSQSIPLGRATTEINNISNNKGMKRWPVNGETCIAFWEKNHSCSCLNCIRVCPFNKPEGLLHELVRSGIKKYPQLNKMFLWGDDIFGYNRRRSPENFWTDKE
jgi:reductive dehalogenase